MGGQLGGLEIWMRVHEGMLDVLGPDEGLSFSSAVYGRGGRGGGGRGGRGGVWERREGWGVGEEGGVGVGEEGGGRGGRGGGGRGGRGGV